MKQFLCIITSEKGEDLMEFSLEGHSELMVKLHARTHFKNKQKYMPRLKLHKNINVEICEA